MSRPAWMSDEEWSEYQMTEEYRQELLYEPDYEPYDPVYDDYYDAMAEQEWEHMWQEGYHAYYNGEVLYGDEPYDFVEGYEFAMYEEERGDVR